MISYISVAELTDLISNQDCRNGLDYVVIDVRDSDFAGGNIPSAINFPANNIHDPAAVQKLLKFISPIHMIVFHCAFSQVRGPKVAKFFRPLLPEQSVVAILEGGFHEWLNHHRGNSALVEITEHSLLEVDFSD